MSRRPASTHAEQEVLKSVIRKIRDGGVTIVVIEHNMGLVMTLCQTITVLAHGKVDRVRAAR